MTWLLVCTILYQVHFSKLKRDLTHLVLIKELKQCLKTIRCLTLEVYLSMIKITYGAVVFMAMKVYNGSAWIVDDGTLIEYATMGNDQNYDGNICLGTSNRFYNKE